MSTPPLHHGTENQDMVKALAYTAQLLGVLSAVLVWVLLIPIVDLLTRAADEHEHEPQLLRQRHLAPVESPVYQDAA
jgi:hypothetical protein